MNYCFLVTLLCRKKFIYGYVQTNLIVDCTLKRLIEIILARFKRDILHFTVGVSYQINAKSAQCSASHVVVQTV